MLRVGQKEIDAVTAVIRSGRLFRYNDQSQCALFEKRYARFLGAKFCHMTSSGTTALTAALAGLGVGPGDEVIVPAHTYMATAVSVLAVGAIPVIVDIDESITIDPDALDDAVGPRTRAVIPVHMWGLPCDMDAVMKVARKRKLLVIEDACQAVGGGYEGRMLGSIGHAGAFSFNAYKNMTCGEGGAVVTSDPRVSEAAHCSIDCCAFYWNGRSEGVRPYTANGSRASEIEGAMMNAQLDQLPALLRTLRSQKKRILKAAANTALVANPCNSPDWECATNTHFLLPTAQQADQFAQQLGCGICGKTGRHTYTEWDPILNNSAGHHPAMNPFNFPQNKPCRRKYTKDMLPRSLDILNRTVMIGNSVDRTAAQVKELIEKIKATAKAVVSAPKRKRAMAMA